MGEESLAIMEDWMKQADPLSGMYQGHFGYALLYLREYDRAIEQAKKMLVLEPDSPHPYPVLIASYAEKGMEMEAFEAICTQLLAFGASQEEVVAEQERLKKSGMEGLWKRQLADLLKQESPRLVGVANLYAKLGRKDEAFAWLEKAWNKPLFGYEYAPSCSWWDPLRSDPRFEELLRKQNLPEEAIQRHLALPGG